MIDYNLLPAPYLAELTNIFETARITQDAGKRRLAFNKYSKIFTALPRFWYYWAMSERNEKNGIFNEEDVKFIKKLRKMALSNFFNEEFLTEMSIKHDGSVIDRYPDNDRAYQKVFSLPYFRDDCYKVVKKRKEYLELLGSYLTFPHHHIQAVFDLYQEYSDTFISNEAQLQYKKNFNFYQKLNKAFEEKNIENWIKLLLDTQDEDLIIQNMEYYISKRPHVKSAWKLYILYLYLNDKEEILGVYSRYCRFFITDEQMINQYFTEIISQQKSGINCIKYIIDLLDLLSFNKSYEKELLKTLSQKELNNYTKLEEKLLTYDRSLQQSRTLNYANIWFIKKNLSFLKACNNIVGNGEILKLKNISYCETSYKCDLKWNDLNLKQQRFPFCSTIMRHISKNLNCRQKLYQTCKYFFAMSQIPICYGLRIKEKNGDGLEFWGSTIEISKDFFNQQITSPDGDIAFKEFLNNTVVATVLSINNSTNRTCFTQLISLKNDIEIRYLSLSFQDLSLNDIAIFQQKCKLISVKLIKCNIFTLDGSFAAIENVVANLATVKYLELNCETLIYTQATATKLLSNLPENTKFNRFAIFWVTNVLDLNVFCEFLKRHTAPNCHLCIDYHPNFKATLQPEYLRIIAAFVYANPELHPLVIADH